MHEQENEIWAKRMKDFLILAKQEVEKYPELNSLSAKTLLRFEQKYNQILTEGIAYHLQLPLLPSSKRGKQKQRAGKNLLDRLKEKRDCVLRFMYDFSIPFTNNQAEQDIRMVKLKQKIAGCFRTLAGGILFCRIRSYISTVRKQGIDIWNALIDAISGKPFCLDVPSNDILQVDNS